MNKKILKKIIIGTILWNIIALCYHYFYIGMTLKNSAGNQGLAMFIELLVAGYYKNYLLYYEEKINKTTKHITMKKYFIFTALFGVIYGGTYFIRLEIFYLNDLITKEQIVKSMIIMSLFSIALGYIIGWCLLREKSKEK